MAPPNFALCFTCLLVVNMAHTTALKQSSLHFLSANVGESVTLSCSCPDDESVIFYWYKQTAGLNPKLVSSFYSYNANSTLHDEFKNPRFSVDSEKHKYQLKISDLRISDSGTYYCIGSNLYALEFCEGRTVTIKGSELKIPVLVHPSASETIQPGGSVTLNCTVHNGTCDGEHSVYWFKNSGESHPGLIYTHGGRKGQCERNPNTQTHSCVYSLPLKSLNLSHAETFSCAVASCGHILFGDEIKFDIENEVDSLVSLVYILSAALALTTILVVLLAFTVYKMSKRKCQYTEPNETFSPTSAPNAAPCQDTENLHYAALRDLKANRSRRQKSNTNDECVYSSVKQ
uniref:immunoglobulin kappa light chain-like n=1 Tax=Scatophagus argus TaxID=75038 RepID=UPI001ED85951|nr:immunoglobulin kappa light chain-like [Scatophagus argus]